MPEIPDLEAYIKALRSRVLGHELKGVRLGNPFLLRTVDPPLSSVAGRMVIGIERLGKRLVLALDDDLSLVLLDSYPFTPFRRVPLRIVRSFETGRRITCPAYPAGFQHHPAGSHNIEDFQ